MKISTAPTPNSISVVAKAATPHGPGGAAASSSQPQPHRAMPSRRQGPGPILLLIRLPKMLASTVPAPMLT